MPTKNYRTVTTSARFEEEIKGVPYSGNFKAELLTLRSRNFHTQQMHCWIIFERLGAGRDSPIGTGRGEFLLEEGETQGKWEGFQIPFQSFDLKCNPTPAIHLLNFRTPPNNL